MIARSACMLALVIAWSGYLAGLNWLTASPDPWLVAHKNSAQPVAKKRATSSSIECACRKSNPDILVVQPAENWAAKNLPGSFDGTRERRILLQR
jgi:hypothetical protein